MRKHESIFFFVVLLGLLIPGTIFSQTQPQPAFDFVTIDKTEININESFYLSIGVSNNGATTDQGYITVSFPSLTSCNWGEISICTGSCTTYCVNDEIWHKDCYKFPAQYPMVELADYNWINGRSHSFYLKITPKDAGDFVIYIRSAMHVTGGGDCEFINAVPQEGTLDTDQQGWTVKKFVVHVNGIPELQINEPSTDISITKGEDLIIKYNYETDDEVMMSFFYSSSCYGEGNVIINNLTGGPDGSQSQHAIVWETDNVYPGTYRVWGRISDGVNTTESCAIGRVTVTDHQSPEITVITPSEDFIKFFGGSVNISCHFTTYYNSILNIYAHGQNQNNDLLIYSIRVSSSNHDIYCKWILNNLSKDTYTIYAKIDDGTYSDIDYAPGKITLCDDIEPVILIHGITGNPESWANLETILKEDGLEVYSFKYDQDYSNLSDLSDFNVPLEDIANINLVDFLAEKGINGQFNIIAHSMGGLISRCYIINHPDKVKRLILLDTPNYGADPYGIVGVVSSIFSTKQVEELDFGSEFIWNLDALWRQKQDEIITEVFPIVATEDDKIKIITTDIVLFQSAGLENLGYKNCYVENNHGNINDFQDRGHNCYKPIMKFLADRESEINYRDYLAQDNDKGLLMLLCPHYPIPGSIKIDGESALFNRPEIKNINQVRYTMTWPKIDEGDHTINAIISTELKTLDEEYGKLTGNYHIERGKATVGHLEFEPPDAFATNYVASGTQEPVSFEATDVTMEFENNPGGEISVAKNDIGTFTFGQNKMLPYIWQIGSEMEDGSFNVTLKFKYDEAELTSIGIDEENLRIYCVTDTLIPIETTIDIDNNVVSANLTHFSSFAVGEYHYSNYGGDCFAVCGNSSDQKTPQSVSDTQGNKIVVWQDFRNGNWDIYAQKIDANGNHLWADDILICNADGDQTNPNIVSDGNDGAIIAWSDKRSTRDADFYAQKISSDGTLLWNPQNNGVPVTGATNCSFYPPKLAPTPEGGVIVAWSTKDPVKVYAQKLSAEGENLWNDNGVIIGGVTNREYAHKILPDGNGGAFITWCDGNSYNNKGIFLTHVDANGTLTWGPLHLVDRPDIQTHSYIARVSDDYLITTWWSKIGGASERAIFAQKINCNDGSTVWETDGKKICSTHTTYPHATYQSTVWETDGKKICSTHTTYPHATYQKIAYDNNGGVVIAYRSGDDIYAQRISIDDGGKLYTQDEYGLPICTATGVQGNPQVIIENDGTALIAWEDSRSGNSNIYFQRVDLNGNTLMDENGTALCQTNQTQSNLHLCKDTFGNITITFEDNRTGNYDIYGYAALTIEPTNSPELSWSSEPGFITDGVSPNIGLPGDLFEFRIVYKDEDNDPPLDGYPKLLIDANGDGDTYDEYEGVYTMEPASSGTDYVNGEEYIYRISLPEPPGKHYWYKFVAEDTRMQQATGEPTEWKDDLKVGHFPDLVVSAADMEFSNQNPDTLEVFSIAVTINNDSDVEVNNVTYRIYVEGGENIATGSIAYIDAHSWEKVSATTSFTNEGYYIIKVVIDDENSIEELDETNNSASRPIPVGSTTPASIEITNVPQSVQGYSQHTIYVTGHAKYVGTVIPDYSVLGALVTFEPSWTESSYITRTNGSGNFSKLIPLPEVQSEETETLTVYVTDFTLTGDTTITVIIEPNPEPQEGADLAIVISNTTIPCEGGQSTISWYVKNIGNQATTSETTARLIINSDTLATETIPQLQPDEKYLLPDANSGSITERTAVISEVDKLPGEISYTNNSYTRYITPYPLCVDLAVWTLSMSDYHPVLGQEVTFSLWVVNRGCQESQPTQVLFKVDGVEDSTINIGTIQGMETALEKVQFKYTFSDCQQHQFTFIIDSEDINANECNENNNTTSRTMQVAGADLKLISENIDYTYCRYEDYGDDHICIMDTLWIKVINIGEMDATNVELKIWIDDVEMGDTILTNVAASDTLKVSYPINWQVPTAKNYVAKVCADPYNLIPERYENNNCATRDIDLSEDPCSVNLISLTANSKHDGVVISWELSNNTRLCALERKLKGNHSWKRIATDIKPVETGDTQKYSYLDKNVETGQGYEYRILAADESMVFKEVGFIEIKYSPQLPKAAALLPNYPNPFNPTTNIKFALPERQKVTLRIYDVNGHLIKVLLDTVMPAGYNSVTWDGKDEHGNTVTSGIYFCQADEKDGAFEIDNAT